MQSVDPGFGREPTALMTFLTPATRFAPDEARFHTRRLLDRYHALPGVEPDGPMAERAQVLVGIRKALGTDGALVVPLLVVGGLKLVVPVSTVIENSPAAHSGWGSPSSRLACWAGCCWRSMRSTR